MEEGEGLGMRLPIGVLAPSCQLYSGTHSGMRYASGGVLEGREESDGQVVGHLQKSLGSRVIRREERGK